MSPDWDSNSRYLERTSVTRLWETIARAVNWNKDAHGRTRTRGLDTALQPQKRGNQLPEPAQPCFAIWRGGRVLEVIHAESEQRPQATLP